jgi:polysaccharide pyruvyl transferase CsaB
MSNSENYNLKRQDKNIGRSLVIITGYYGFDNLGDEAILEELLHETSLSCARENIIVLSNNPERTTAIYGVKSINRWRWFEYTELFKKAKLLISGGGGLFQDKNGPRSVIFYAAQIFLAKLMGAKVLIYAQGLGPLNSNLGRTFTKFAFGLANAITLRDKNSIDLIKSWGLEGKLTADPVWALSPSILPEPIQLKINKLKEQGNKVIGLSLREDPALKSHHLEVLAEAIARTYTESTILLLPLQNNQDLALLKEAAECLKKYGIKSDMLDSSLLIKPSNWLALMQNLDLVIGMRLHALLMALKSSKPVIGIAYDPKVTILLTDFNQPLLSLAHKEKNDFEKDWLQTIGAAKDISFDQSSKDKLVIAEQSAEKNATQLADILKG